MGGRQKPRMLKRQGARAEEGCSQDAPMGSLLLASPPPAASPGFTP